MQSKKNITRFESRSFRDSKRTPHAKTRSVTRRQQRQLKSAAKSAKR